MRREGIITPWVFPHFERKGKPRKLIGKQIKVIRLATKRRALEALDDPLPKPSDTAETEVAERVN